LPYGHGFAPAHGLCVEMEPFLDPARRRDPEGCPTDPPIRYGTLGHRAFALHPHLAHTHLATIEGPESEGIATVPRQGDLDAAPRSMRGERTQREAHGGGGRGLGRCEHGWCLVREAKTECFGRG